MFANKTRAVLGAIAVLALGAAGGAALGSPDVASAQTGDDTTTQSGDDRAHERRGLDVEDAVEEAARALDMRERDLWEELAQGRSIAEVAGTDLNEVMTAIADDITREVDEEVAEGDWTGERGEEVLAGLSDRVEALVQSAELQDHDDDDHDDDYDDQDDDDDCDD